MWIEGNAQGVLIDATPTYNSFIGGTITVNTTNITDNAKNTSILGTQIGSVAVTQLTPYSAVDKGNASAIIADLKNNTSFAHTGSALQKIELLNASDTSTVQQLKNAGTGKFVSYLVGAVEQFSVSAVGALFTNSIELGNASDTTLSRLSA